MSKQTVSLFFIVLLLSGCSSDSHPDSRRFYDARQDRFYTVVPTHTQVVVYNRYNIYPKNVSCAWIGC